MKIIKAFGKAFFLVHKDFMHDLLVVHLKVNSNKLCLKRHGPER